MQIVSQYCAHKNESEEVWDIIISYTMDNILALIPSEQESVKDFIVRSMCRSRFPDSELIYSSLENFDVSEGNPYLRLILTVK